MEQERGNKGEEPLLFTLKKQNDELALEADI